VVVGIAVAIAKRDKSIIWVNPEVAVRIEGDPSEGHYSI
jgi:hypothetical protein